MTIILIKVCFPLNKTKALAQKSYETFKTHPISITPDMKELDGITAGKEGGERYQMIEVPDEALGKMVKEITQHFLVVSELEGITYEIKILMSPAEAFQMMGMSL